MGQGVGLRGISVSETAASTGVGRGGVVSGSLTTSTWGWGVGGEGLKVRNMNYGSAFAGH